MSNQREHRAVLRTFFTFPANLRAFAFPRTALIVVVATLSWSLPAATAREGLTLERLVHVARSGRQYRAATPDELVRFEELFVRLLRDPQSEGLADDWQQLGFQLHRLDAPGVETWAIAEPPRNKRGWGLYVICPRRLPGMVLQAPHSYADRYTGNVALRMFADGTFSAAAWNTVPRKMVDVAHTIDHPFTVFTRAIIRVNPESSVIQIHGFAQEKRTGLAGAADIVISNGTRAPDRAIRRLTVQLQTEFPFGQVHLYPTEVQELGATRNIQGETLRQAGSARFIHIELSQPLRLQLVNDPRARGLLLKNLASYDD